MRESVGYEDAEKSIVRNKVITHESKPRDFRNCSQFPKLFPKPETSKKSSLNDKIEQKRFDRTKMIINHFNRIK